MLKIFFSPENAETAAGMFTPPHLIFLTLCLISIGIAVYFSRNLSEKSITKIIRIFAVVFTAIAFFTCGICIICAGSTAASLGSLF